MMRLLAAAGRFVTVVFALIIILSSAISSIAWGPLLQAAADAYIAANPPSAKNAKAVEALHDAVNNGAILAGAGALGGLLVAGTIFGLLAAVFDTHIAIRRLVAVSERSEALLRVIDARTAVEVAQLELVAARLERGAPPR
jgi:hypothetical protein